MKAKEITALLLLAAVCATACYGVVATKSLTEQMDGHITKAQAHAEDGNWDDALSEAQAVYNTWQENETFAKVFLNNDEISHTKIALFDFLSAVYARDEFRTRCSCEALRDKLSGIRRMEELHTESIL